MLMATAKNPPKDHLVQLPLIILLLFSNVPTLKKNICK